MVKNGSPQTGDIYLRFNGRDSYVEIPSIADYSASTTGKLTIAAWIRPDTLNFPSVERNSAYVHWLGKGERSGAAGNQEWALRMYNHHDPLDRARGRSERVAARHQSRQCRSACTARDSGLSVSQAGISTWTGITKC
jgi:hypothetical protein